MDEYEQSSHDYALDPGTGLVQMGFFKTIFENGGSQVSDLPDLSLKLDLEENFETPFSYNITPLDIRMLTPCGASFLSPESVAELTAALKKHSPLLPLAFKKVDTLTNLNEHAGSSPETSAYPKNYIAGFLRENKLAHKSVPKGLTEADKLRNPLGSGLCVHFGANQSSQNEIGCSPLRESEATASIAKRWVLYQPGPAELFQSEPLYPAPKDQTDPILIPKQSNSKPRKRFGRRLEDEYEDGIQDQSLLRNPIHPPIEDRVNPVFKMSLNNFSSNALNDSYCEVKMSPKSSGVQDVFSKRKAALAQSTSVKSLKTLSQRVKELVREKHQISYKKVVEILIKESELDLIFQPAEEEDAKHRDNLKRRVYDALNVLAAAGVLNRNGDYVSCANEKIKPSTRSLIDITQQKSSLLNQLELANNRVLSKKEALRKCALKYLTVRNLIALNKQSVDSSEARIELPFVVVSTKTKSMSLSMSSDLKELAISSNSMINVCGDVDTILKLPRCKVSEEMSEALKSILTKKIRG